MIPLFHWSWIDRERNKTFKIYVFLERFTLCTCRLWCREKHGKSVLGHIQDIKNINAKKQKAIKETN